MPGSRRTFTYRLTPKPEDTDKVLRQAQKVLAWACDGEPRVTECSVTGESLGLVILSATVHARDRYAAGQLMQDILNQILWGLGHPKELQLQLQSERQPPHASRGYAHGRTKRYREPRTAPGTSSRA